MSRDWDQATSRTGGRRTNTSPETLHTIGPVWNGGGNNEDELLANCYRNSLALAVQNDVRTIAFPAISTGIYRFPLGRAAEIALRETLSFLAHDATLKKVTFVCFNVETYEAYRETLKRLPQA